MSSEGSVTHWLGQLQAGDQAAAQKLWERYFQRLVGLARSKLHGRRSAAADEEDAALSAFDSFCRGAERGRFPLLEDRDGLWRLLVTLTVRKAHHLVRDEHRQKRGGGAVWTESARAGRDGADERDMGLDQLLSPEPTPAFAAQVAEECQRLLGSLGDVLLQSIAVWKMEGDTNDEIAAKLNCAPSTVERRLALIRRIWQEASAS